MSMQVFKRIFRFLIKNSRLFSSLFWNMMKVTRNKRYNSFREQVRVHSTVECPRDFGKLCVKVYRDSVLYGTIPEEYFFFNFSDLSDEGKSRYITNGLRNRYLAKINRKSDWNIFMNKMETYNRFQPFYKREVVEISGEKDREAFMSFVDRHRSIVIKPIVSSRGNGVRVLELTPDKAGQVCTGLLEENEKGFIVEEKIVQDEQMAIFNNTSVNTVRCPTVITENGTVVPFNPILRMGRKGSVIDNGAAGGILASIDPETGIVYTAGKDEFGNTFIVHPDSGIPIPGFKIPEWESLLQIVRQAAQVVPTTRYVGWDMAFSDRGWVIIEGNHYGQFSVLQIPARKGFRYEFEKMTGIC